MATEEPVTIRSETKLQKEVIKTLEDVSNDFATKDWNVSQDDIHFCVNMLDKHGQVKSRIICAGSKNTAIILNIKFSNVT